jgi:electron transfer flavoprotein alpha subunit
LVSDFETALQAKLARNEELARQRAQAEHEMDRVKADRAAEAERQAQQAQEARNARHAELVEHVQSLTAQLRQSSPESFVLRQGWTESGEEFISRLSTRQMEPARTLFIELDRDDDEVLVRWSSALGNAIELWRLLEVEPALLTELVLQAADQELWRGRNSPPPFPGHDDDEA